MYDVFKTRANIFVFYYVINLHNGKNDFESEVIDKIDMDDYELLGMPEKFRWAVLKMICKKDMSVLSSLKSSMMSDKSTTRKNRPEVAKNTSFTSDESVDELSTDRKKEDEQKPEISSFVRKP